MKTGTRKGINMDIKFHTPQSETIPTQMRLKVDGVDVYYDKVPGKFAYTFKFFKIQDVTMELAKTIVDEVVDRMKEQSYDHGAQWRETSCRSVYEDEYDITITVFFYKRDAG